MARRTRNPRKGKLHAVQLTYAEMTLITDLLMSTLTKNCKSLHMLNKKHLKKANDVNGLVRNSILGIGEVYLPLIKIKPKAPLTHIKRS